MKNFKIKNDEGFTLVELMVVVAIIGILSAVAIPNFKKYQAKSKQSEAKIQLAAIYTAEVSTSGNYNTYANCFSDMGVETPARGFYATGIGAALEATTQGIYNTAAGGGTNPCGVVGGFNIFPTNHLFASTAAVTVMPAGTSVTQTLFVAGAVGRVSSNAAAANDFWTINQAKAIVNATVGL